MAIEAKTWICRDLNPGPSACCMSMMQSRLSKPLIYKPDQNFPAFLRSMNTNKLPSSSSGSAPCIVVNSNGCLCFSRAFAYSLYLLQPGFPSAQLLSKMSKRDARDRAPRVKNRAPAAVQVSCRVARRNSKQQLIHLVRSPLSNSFEKRRSDRSLSSRPQNSGLRTLRN